ncbi:Protein CHROMOSOME TRANSMISSION FIDELITY 7 [Raphanus sativus]|nr:Protein CHROMOSOME TRANSMISSION FIDELITY 7 [Raphanus sativus]
MQSKINYFFKPSSPSPIATSVTPDTTDDSLAAWENNRNVIVNTYQRRSPKAVRSEVLKEPIGERPRKGPKTLNKKKRSCYTQFHLELGQSDFLFRHCGWQNERAFTSPSLGKNRIVVVLENDSPAHRNKVQEVVKMMEVELGEDWILHRYCKVYLLVSSQRISGCLVAEPIKEAFKIISRLDDGRQLKKESSSPSTTIHFGNIVLQRQVSKRCRESDDRLDNGATACEEEAKPAFCGVRAIWVSPSNRRKGLATQLLDTARESFSSGCILEKSQLAFSDHPQWGIIANP